jgi:hypothetical protein
VTNGSGNVWVLSDDGAELESLAYAIHQHRRSKNRVEAAGKLATEIARKAFIATARDVGILIGEAPLRG